MVSRGALKKDIPKYTKADPSGRARHIVPAKPSAAERTISLFSGKTKVEEEAKVIAEAEDAKETGKAREPITQEAIDNELLHYMRRGDKPLTGWRLTAGQSDTYHLERLRDNGTTYSGLLLAGSDIPELLALFQEAHDARRLRG